MSYLKADSEYRTQVLKLLKDKLAYDDRWFTEKLLKREFNNLKEKKAALTEIRTQHSEILKNGPDEIINNLEQLGGFPAPIVDSWGKPLILLNILLIFSKKMLDEFNPPIDSNENRIHVMETLHANACRVASEIYYLLSGGFADGALGRCRTFIEIVVYAKFIDKYGEDAAEAFINHGYYFKCKDELYDTEKIKPSKTGEIRPKFEQRYPNIYEKYGDSFLYDYGWASPFLKKKNIRFHEIVEETNYEELKAYYSHLNSRVHVDYYGSITLDGIPKNLRAENRLSGPSPIGLKFPSEILNFLLTIMDSLLLDYSLNTPFNIAKRFLLLFIQSRTNDLFSVVENQLQTRI